MKQHITQNQWDEISIKEKLLLFNWKKEDLEKPEGVSDFHICVDTDENDVTIGLMIEYLGVDKFKNFEKFYSKCIGITYMDLSISWEKGELCDTLWEACKHKLKI